jgi:hypothetical protein
MNHFIYIAKDYPVTCAEYANKNVLLDTLCWKRCKRLGTSEEKIERMVSQAKIKRYLRDHVLVV